jgi:hypothetical protein
MSTVCTVKVWSSPVVKQVFTDKKYILKSKTFFGPYF